MHKCTVWDKAVLCSAAVTNGYISARIESDNEHHVKSLKITSQQSCQLKTFYMRWKFFF
jgi:hypothetical protein